MQGRRNTMISSSKRVFYCTSRRRGVVMRVCVAHVVSSEFLAPRRFYRNNISHVFCLALSLLLGLLIKLDPFQAMQRLNKLILKSHGACRAFLKRLRDAFFKVYRSYLEEVEAALRQQGKSDAETKTMKEQKWGFFLSLCRW